MTQEEFRNLKQNDIIVLNDEQIENHKKADKLFWGGSLSIISDLRKKYSKDTKFQIDNCAEVKENWFMIKFFADGVVSKNTFNRPFVCVSENLCVFFDKID